MKKLLGFSLLILALLCVFISCKEHDNEDTTPQEQHIHIEVIDEAVAPTIDEDGLTEGKHCSSCGEILVPQEKIPALNSPGLAYEVNDDGVTCTITGKGSCTDSEIYIGTIIDGYKITAIADRAFYNCTTITSVSISNSVISIGSEAFSVCTELATVTISDSVTSIGRAAFFVCPSLTSVTLGDSVTTIGYYAFYHCKRLTSVVIPDSVTTIGKNAFFFESLASATFCNPNGWQLATSQDAALDIKVDASELSNPETAARYLKSDYNEYWWYRTE